MDPYYGTYFKEMGATRGLMNYFETILANLKVFPHYQSVGHLDMSAATCQSLHRHSFMTILQMFLMKFLLKSLRGIVLLR